ncbi:O-antigen ligase family protein [Saccharothrix luteola]|uniref:O-antigen ligase family protein n=1 Tax=Saccharothrix luteola TaxID=2893018 RepID=UPI001E657085|nr:O-antigen ligase family protein [Saccharothrix luteola]MCC8250579.1 O-antigen ligase family protein [Saccharothrix luteola]
MGGLAHDHVRARDAVALPHAVLLVLAAIAAAVVAQGGYYLPGRLFTGALVAFALVLALRDRPAFGLVPVACAGLAAWAVLRAALDGDVTRSLPAVAAVGCLAAAVVVVRGADARQRELCASVLVGAGALVALTGWVAVVWRVPSWSVVADGLARAASTLTYPNAAAALLAALTVLALALNTAHPDSLPHAAAVYALVVGVGATLSRAGLLALLAGVVALAVFNGVRASLRHAGPPVLGALIALGALAPSFPAAEPAGPALAVAGLVVGLAVTAGLNRVTPLFRLVGVVAGLAAIGLGALFALDLGRLLAGRISTGSPDRTGATGAALDLVAARPVSGVGPGNGWFAFTGPGGESRVMRYVHNEYLQVLVELGAIGLGLVLLVLAALAVTVWRGRAGSSWAGAAAGLVVLLVHSGFDFLWHLPVIVLTAGLLAGLASPEPTARTPVPAAPTAEENR